MSAPQPIYLHHEHLPSAHHSYYLGWEAGAEDATIPGHTPDDALHEEAVRQAVRYTDTPYYAQNIEPVVRQLPEQTDVSHEFAEHLFVDGFTDSVVHGVASWIPLLALQSEFRRRYDVDLSVDVRSNEENTPPTGALSISQSQSLPDDLTIASLSGTLAERIVSHSLLTDLEIHNQESGVELAAKLPENE